MSVRKMFVHKRHSILLALVAALVTAGCATTNSDGASDRRDMLSREAILGVEGATNLHDVVRRLRPRWLTVRAAGRSMSGATAIVVFQNQSYQGGVETLRQFDPSSAYELRYMDGPTASASLSGLPSQHVAGAIIINTRPPGD